MFCRNCGKEIPDQVRFCPACGCQLKQTSATPQQSVENPDQLISQQHVYNQSQATSQTVTQQQGMIAQQTVNQKSEKREKVRKKWKTEAGIVTIIIGALLMIVGGAAIDDGGLPIFILGISIVCCGGYHLSNVTDKVEGITKIIGGSLTFLTGVFIMFDIDFYDLELTVTLGSILFLTAGIVIVACKNKKNAGITEFWLGLSLVLLGCIMDITYADFFVACAMGLVMITNGGTRWSFWRRKFENGNMKK